MPGINTKPSAETGKAEHKGASMKGLPPAAQTFKEAHRLQNWECICLHTVQVHTSTTKEVR